MSSVATTKSALAVGFSFPIIDGILVALRFYTRRHLKSDLQVDDWLCIPAWLCLTGTCASLLAGVFNGAFTDEPVTDPVEKAAQEHTLAQVTAALVILWMATNFFIKMLMLFFYRRIFMGLVFDVCNWTLMGLSVVWFIYAVLSWFLYCGSDLKADFEGPWVGCPLWGFQIQMGVFALDSFIDLCLLLLPIPFVWHLLLDFKRKIAVSVVFILGGFAFVAGLNNTIIQLVYLTNPDVANGDGANFFQGSSLLFSNWPAIEVGVGLLASNLPHLSFRLARALTQSLPRALRLSLNSLRAAAAALSINSLRSSARSTRPSTRHPYEQGERRPSDQATREDHAESSTQGLHPDLTIERWEEVDRAKSLEQSSKQSAESIELRDLEANRPRGEAM
ncbi:hypothetical protein F4819DRAFT_489753 [Hypoxylon fuscum]|nr:hypothetical protein F4819DRAFT_489753 [Hypoxylon fuscum]